MKHDPKKQNQADEPDATAPRDRADGVREPETTPAQERGERIDTGKSIARGGKEEGRVPGAEEESRH